MQNKNDFSEMITQCHSVGLMIWRAVSGAPEVAISPQIMQALVGLQEFLKTVEEDMLARSQSGVAARVLSISVDQKAISSWKEKLDFYLKLFNTELNIAANMKLDELIEMFEDFRQNSLGQIKNEGTEHTERAPVPPAPSRFFGRFSIVINAVKALLKREHITLLGPGGIGKSSIAKVVINNDEIAAKYKQRRYFVSYDDMDISQISFGTFIDRLARAFGIKITKSTSTSDIHNSILSHMAHDDLFLVIDNAETVLDADHDAGRIANAIAGFGDMPSLAIMITTRSRKLPPNLACTTVSVPALEEDAAHKLFTAVYSTVIPIHIVQKLLSALDFHPLSINLLAHAAVQNEWSPDELMDAWDKQQAHLLDIGEGKSQSLRVSIELSLHSPSIQKLGDYTLSVLQIIALLPQGVNKKKLSELFPTISTTISDILNKLSQHSLTYRAGDSHFTMLAPIRLYIATAYPTLDTRAAELLDNVKKYYYNQLENDGNQLWFMSEDANIERSIALGLGTDSHGNDVTKLATVCRACIQFIGQVKEVVSLLNEAKRLLPFGNRPEMRTECQLVLGNILQRTGNFTTSESEFQLGLDIATRSKDLNVVAEFQRVLGLSKSFRGKQAESIETFLEAYRYYEKQGNEEGMASVLSSMGFAQMYTDDLEASSQSFTSAFNIYSRMPGMDHYMEKPECLAGLSGVLHMQQRWDEARKLLNQTIKLVQDVNDQGGLARYLSIKGALEADAGDIEAGRRLVTSAVEVARRLSGGAEIPSEFLNWIKYISARNELHAGNSESAKLQYLKVERDCEEMSDIRFRARSLRALGEIALVQNDGARAKMYFQDTENLCNKMGIPTMRLYACHVCYRLNSNFKGWDMYQRREL
ncbi:hypothetical protein BDQ17DRAFT_1427324 [Cyathus striatus]|nr:hypothetical protein BDQ17DRAFT_1427324 [Cyathus striatus]